jgi:hypothetical protein
MQKFIRASFKHNQKNYEGTQNVGPPRLGWNAGDGIGGTVREFVVSNKMYS